MPPAADAVERIGVVPRDIDFTLHIDVRFLDIFISSK